jgi:hypothetical protein
MIRDSRADVDNTDDENFRMNDIWDGAMWTKCNLGMKRTRQNSGTILDVEAFPGSKRLVHKTKHCLFLTINLDWYAFHFL